ncbi:MAG: UDP-N-acetylmuramoyl-tripeptide--D-alanyl-D-alanine ligase [Pseudomonadota bacterium]
MNDDLWTAYEAAAATGGALCARGDGASWPAEEWAARGVSIDTRNIKPGELFVALRDQRDGHEFVRNAFGAGAAAALVSRAPDDAPAGAPLLVVGDTLQGLRDLAVAARMRNFGKRIAVTGSAGKTSTKEMLRDLLGAQCQVHAAERSFNNHWGVPLTLAQLPMRSEYSVFEIGMNHAGEITPLSKLVRPHAAIVTTVAPAHLAAFKDVSEIAEAKAEIFLGLAPGGVAILPLDNEHYPLLRDRAERAGAACAITFGESSEADFQLESHEPSESGAVLSIRIFGKRHKVEFGLAGRHQACNALAALAAAHSVGADIEAALGVMPSIQPVDGRGALAEVPVGDGKAILVDESYNANPASMHAALEAFASTPAKRRIIVLGEMLELGPRSAEFHAALGRDINVMDIDRIYAVGGLMEELWTVTNKDRRAAFAKSADHLINAVIDDIRAGDAIMVKGSNGSKVSLIAKAIRLLAEGK